MGLQRQTDPEYSPQVDSPEQRVLGRDSLGPELELPEPPVLVLPELLQMDHRMELSRERGPELQGLELPAPSHLEPPELERVPEQALLVLLQGPELAPREPQVPLLGQERQVLEPLGLEPQAWSR